MDMFTKLCIGFISSMIILSVAVGGLQGCAKAHPEHAGRVMTRLVSKGFNDTDDTHSIYVIEYEPDAEGKEVIKCYDVPEDIYYSLKPGDEYVPVY